MLRSTARVPALVDLVRGYSRLGEHGAVWIAMGVAGAALDPPRRRRWLRGAAVVAGAHATAAAVKLAVRRRRPELAGLEALVRTPTALSFPSSHAAGSFAAARAFGPLVGAGPMYAAAGAMALSRVQLGVHYPSDVLAGAALGAALGGLAR